MKNQHKSLIINMTKIFFYPLKILSFSLLPNPQDNWECIGDRVYLSPKAKDTPH